MQHPTKNPKRSHQRRGGVMVAVMLCVLVVSLISVSLVKLALAQRRQVRRAELQLQAECLAQSALDRAATRIQADPNYSGETWERSAESFPGNRAGVVRIVVASVDAKTTQRRVSVVADYPAGTEQRARVSRETTIELKIPNEGTK